MLSKQTINCANELLKKKKNGKTVLKLMKIGMTWQH